MHGQCFLCSIARSLIFYFLFLFSGYLRLGAMARDKGNFYEASDWFKEALQINQVCNPVCNPICLMLKHLK